MIGCSRRSLALPGDGLHHTNDRAAKAGVLNTHKGFHQSQPVGRRQKIGDIGGRRRIPERLSTFRQLRPSFEEEMHRRVEDLGYRLQPAGADAIGALLVFLNLLEGQPERIGEFLLAQAEHHPTHAHAAADILIGWIGNLRH